MIEQITDSFKPKLSQKARLRYEEVRQVDLLLLPERVVKLNATAAAILRLCDGNRTAREIAEEMETRYAQSGLIGDIMEFLQKASEQRWID
jgi:pyrroloquinoline quinone biosynthesis protein D